MQKFLVILFLVLTITTGTILLFSSSEKTIVKNEIEFVEPESHPKQLEPTDHWYRMRAYPDGFNEQEFLQQMQYLKEQAEETAANRTVDLTMPWMQEGPGNIGGRFNALAISPTNQNIIYAGACNGGIFKTTDGGGSCDPIFDDNPYLAIGEITLVPNDWWWFFTWKWCLQKHKCR